MTMPISTKKSDGGHVKGAAAVPSVIEFRVQVTLPNSKVTFWTVHGFYSTPPANLQTVANGVLSSINASWTSQLAPLLHTATLLQGLQARDMSNVNNPVIVATQTSQPGTSASPALPPGVAAVLTEIINARGRGLKGRIFLGGWAANADTGAGVISTATQSALNNFGTALFSGLQGQSLTPCVAQVHRQQYQGVTGTVHADRPAGHVNVTNYICANLIWDAQRRRAQL
jgi:hypothetical protein